jgi:hypothetical protein
MWRFSILSLLSALVAFPAAAREASPRPIPPAAPIVTPPDSTISFADRCSAAAKKPDEQKPHVPFSAYGK